jgi:hypothetical protein
LKYGFVVPAMNPSLPRPHDNNASSAVSE